MTITFYWELIASSHSLNTHAQTIRAKVIGGWIVTDSTWRAEGAMCQSSVFVPDPEHKWEV